LFLVPAGTVWQRPKAGILFRLTVECTQKKSFVSLQATKKGKVTLDAQSKRGAAPPLAVASLCGVAVEKC